MMRSLVLEGPPASRLGCALCKCPAVHQVAPTCRSDSSCPCPAQQNKGPTVSSTKEAKRVAWAARKAAGNSASAQVPQPVSHAAEGQLAETSTPSAFGTGPPTSGSQVLQSAAAQPQPNRQASAGVVAGFGAPSQPGQPFFSGASPVRPVVATAMQLTFGAKHKPISHALPFNACSWQPPGGFGATAPTVPPASTAAAASPGLQTAQPVAAKLAAAPAAPGTQRAPPPYAGAAIGSEAATAAAPLHSGGVSAPLVAQASQAAAVLPPAATPASQAATVPASQTPAAGETLQAAAVLGLTPSASRPQGAVGARDGATDAAAATQQRSAKPWLLQDRAVEAPHPDHGATAFGPDALPSAAAATAAGAAGGSDRLSSPVASAAPDARWPPRNEAGQPDAGSLQQSAARHSATAPPRKQPAPKAPPANAVGSELERADLPAAKPSFEKSAPASAAKPAAAKPSADPGAAKFAASSAAAASDRMPAASSGTAPLPADVHAPVVAKPAAEPGAKPSGALSSADTSSGLTGKSTAAAVAPVAAAPTATTPRLPAASDAKDARKSRSPQLQRPHPAEALLESPVPRQHRDWVPDFSRTAAVPLPCTPVLCVSQLLCVAIWCSADASAGRAGRRCSRSFANAVENAAILCLLPVKVRFQPQWHAGMTPLPLRHTGPATRRQGPGKG